MLNLAYYLELTWLLTDTVSGLLLNHNVLLPGGLSLGAIFRILVTCLLVIIVMKYYSPSKNIPVALLFLMVVEILFHCSASGPDVVVGDYQYHLKLLLPILFYYVIQCQLKQGVLDTKRLQNIVFCNGAVLIVNLFMFLFGLGFSNYGISDAGEMMGGKGFFYAGNEVNVTLTVIYALFLVIMRDRLRHNYFYLLLSLAIFFLASILLLSKTALLSYLLITLLFLQLYLPALSKIKICLLMASLLAATSGYWLQFIFSAIDRWTFFYHHTATLTSFLTSMRSDRFGSFVHLYRDVFSPLDMLLGRGWMGVPDLGSFEMDVLDLLVSSGLIGLLVYFVWMHWLGTLLRAYLKHKSKELFFGLSVVSLVICISILAGHVIYSAMLSPFLPLFIIFCRSGRLAPDHLLTV